MTKWSKRTTTGFKSGTRATKTINSSGKTRNTLSHNISGTASKKGQGSIRITNTIDNTGKQRTYQTTTSPLGFRTTETLYKSPTTIKTIKPKKIRISSGRRKSTKVETSVSTKPKIDNSEYMRRRAEERMVNHSNDGMGLFLIFFIGAIILFSLSL